jgi:rhodanese-related sulfurtransferase
VAQELRDSGRNAWAIEGGFDAWVEAGLPVETKEKAA